MFVAARPLAVGLGSATLAWLFLLPCFALGYTDDARLARRYGELPLSFEENRGQAAAGVRFAANVNGYSIGIKENGMVLLLPASEGQPARSVAVKLVGANPAARVLGLDPLPGRANYLVGSDSSAWLTNIPTFARVKIAGAYPGIDVVFYGNRGSIEYDLVVAPGANLKRVRLGFEGLDELKRQTNGDLLLRAGDHRLLMKQPLVYQESQGTRQLIASKYKLSAAARDERVAGFEVGTYDRRRPLIVDPTLIYSTYVDAGAALAVDSSGNAYVVGTSVVRKLNPDGTAVLYETHFPSAPVLGAAVDAGGNLWIVGQSYTSPPCGFYGRSFVSRLDASGSSFTFSTCLNMSNYSSANAVAVDAAGNGYVVGSSSGGIPVVNAFQPQLNGNTNAFVTKFSPSGEILYSTYLGGSVDEAYAVAVDRAGCAYVAGKTNSSSFPVANAFWPQPIAAGESVFLTKFNPSGSALVYSTYFVPIQYSYFLGLAVDSADNVYLAGRASSADLPLKNAMQAWPGAPTGFVSKFTPDGQQLVYSTYIKGTQSVKALALDSQGQAHIAGRTTATDLPVKNPLQAARAGSVAHQDAFITVLKPDGSDFVYSTYLGGSLDESVSGIAVDANGNAYIAGSSSSYDFPLANPLPGFSSGAFITKISTQDLLWAYTLSPPAALAGSSAFELTVKGTRFDSGSVVYWNGSARPTRFVSESQLVATIAAADIAAVGEVQVSVRGGGPGPASNSIRFAVVPASGCTYVFFDPLLPPGASGINLRLPGGGATRDLSVRAPAGCPWTATTDVTWLTIPSGASGTGDGVVHVVAAANTDETRTVPPIRWGSVIVGGQSLSYFQYYLPILTSITPSAAVAGSGDFTLVVHGNNLRAPTFKEWPTGSYVQWNNSVPLKTIWVSWNEVLAVVPAANVLSEGTASVRVVDYESGEVSDAVTFSILPPGSCAYLLSPVAANVGAAAGLGATAASAASGCAWSVTNNESWISIIGSNSGVGNGVVYFTFAENTGTTNRIGTLEIAGQRYLLQQLGSSQRYIVPVAVVSEGGIVNGASFAANQPLAAGSIASLFGTFEFIYGYVRPSTNPLPTEWFGTSVIITSAAGTFQVPLLYASESQINFQVPWELAGQSGGALAVHFEYMSRGSSMGNSLSNAELMPLTNVAPGIFSLNSQGTGMGAVLISNTTDLAQPPDSVSGRVSRPANHGDYISIYCTGLGPLTTAPPPSGTMTPLTPLFPISSPATVSIGGVTATPTFAGLAPNFAGLYQADVQVPASVTPGDAVSVFITVAGVTSNAVTIAVR